MQKNTLLLAIVILLTVLDVAGQTGRPMGSPPEKPSGDQGPEINLPEEMRVRMANERAENEHKKVLEDVEKLNQLSDEVAKNYGEHKHISPADITKLRTIEKLAKRVLTHSLGEETGDKDGSTERLPVPDAIDKLKNDAANIEKDMKTATRFVVSATVIANSNEVINLARLIRQKAD
jgi:DNA repair protein RadC